MKTIKWVLLIGAVCLSGFTCLSAQTESQPALGLALKASTNGFGADAVYQFNPRTGLRLGFERLGVKSNFTFEEQSISYDTDVHLKAGSISLLFDFYPAKHFFLTAGAGWNLFQADFDGVAASGMQYGDIVIPKEQIGDFKFVVGPSWKVSPYAGLGFGRTLGLNKKVGFAFEVGGFYQGSPDITITSTGLLSPTSNPDQQQKEKLEKQFSQYSIYPVLKFSLSYKIVTFGQKTEN
jgi:hypothetical protein